MPHVRTGKMQRTLDTGLDRALEPLTDGVGDAVLSLALTVILILSACGSFRF